MIENFGTKEILDQFPEVDFAFAYGSGAIKQGGYAYKKSDKMPMLDIAMAVNDSYAWHKENITRNRSHYSGIFPVTPGIVSFFQDRMQAHFWFNTYITMQSLKKYDMQLKYGVINTSNLVKDLEHWDCLYASGRLHKPIKILKSNQNIDDKLRINCEQAVRTSLLLLPEFFDEIDLYLAIASLSYIGDPRMIFGENPKKVVNLVTPIVSHYREKYQSVISGLLEKSNLTSLNPDKSKFQQNINPKYRWEQILKLPTNLKDKLNISEIEKKSSKPPSNRMVRTALARIVTRSATLQTAKGLISTGFFKSGVYILAKVGKRFKK